MQEALEGIKEDVELAEMLQVNLTLYSMFFFLSLFCSVVWPTAPHPPLTTSQTIQGGSHRSGPPAVLCISLVLPLGVVAAGEEFVGAIENRPAI